MSSFKNISGRAIAETLINPIVEGGLVGRQDLFPVVIFAIILIAALTAIISINSVTGPWKLPDRDNRDLVGRAFTAGDTIPATFAPPFDTALEGQTYLFASASKTSSGATLTVNVTKLPGVERQYIYKKGKYSDGTTWKDFTFNTAPAGGSNWIMNAANFTGAANDIPYGEGYVIVYVCKKYEELSGLKCGPKGLTDSRNWTIQSFTVAYPACATTANQFCNTANNTPLANTTINASATCPGTEKCFKCINNNVNQSKVCVPTQYTCELTANQVCGTNVANASTSGASGTCQTGQCYKCNAGFHKQGSQCVADTSSCPGRECAGTGTRCTEYGLVETCNSGCWGTAVQCGSDTTCYGNSTIGNCMQVPNGCTNDLTKGNICSATAPAASQNRNATAGQCVIGLSCYGCKTGYSFNTTTKTCVQDGCTPKTQAQACGSKQCGSEPDGCGSNINCGSNNGNCPTGQTCNAQEMCETPTATTCTIGTGTYSNGENSQDTCKYCNVSLNTTAWSTRPDQTACTSPSTTGKCVSGTCTCQPKTQAQACGTKQCGTAADGCGGTVSCGTCTSPAVCNAQQMCETQCVPKTSCSQFPGQCGKLDKGCGAGYLDCGDTTNCASGQACSTNQFATQAGTCVAVNACTSTRGSFACPATGCAKPSTVTLKIDGTAYPNYQMCCDTATQCADIAATAYRGGSATCYAVGATTTIGNQKYLCESGNNWKSCSGAGCVPACAAPKCTSGNDCLDQGPASYGYICSAGQLTMCSNNVGETVTVNTQRYMCWNPGDAFGSWVRCGGNDQTPCDTGVKCDYPDLAVCGDKCLTRTACAAEITAGRGSCGGHGMWQCGPPTACTGYNACADGMCWNTCETG